MPAQRRFRTLVGNIDKEAESTNTVFQDRKRVLQARPHYRPNSIAKSPARLCHASTRKQRVSPAGAPIITLQGNAFRETQTESLMVAWGDPGGLQASYP